MSRPIHIRGASVLGSVRFVRESYGPDAHERVLQALPGRHSATFLGPLREGSWEPLEDLVAYMETARSLLAPGDAGFFKRMGAHVGRSLSRSGFRFLLGTHPLTAVPRAAFMWRFLYDAGSVEIVSKSDDEIVFHLVDFVPPGRAQCDRITGFIEGCLEALGVAEPRAEETACVLSGAPRCVMRLTWK